MQNKSAERMRGVVGQDPVKPGVNLIAHSPRLLCRGVATTTPHHDMSVRTTGLSINCGSESRMHVNTIVHTVRFGKRRQSSGTMRILVTDDLQQRYGPEKVAAATRSPQVAVLISNLPMLRN